MCSLDRHGHENDIWGAGMIIEGHHHTQACSVLLRWSGAWQRDGRHEEGGSGGSQTQVLWLRGQEHASVLKYVERPHLEPVERIEVEMKEEGGRVGY